MELSYELNTSKTVTYQQVEWDLLFSTKMQEDHQAPPTVIIKLICKNFREQILLTIWNHNSTS
jgi:hypothetical protein